MGGAEPEDSAVYSQSQGQGLAAIAHDGCRRLADYWYALCRKGDMPRRQDIDPIEISWALSRLFLMDHDAETGHFRYRLAGDDIEAAFAHATGRHSVKGASMEDLLVPDSAEVVRQRWSPLAEHGHLIYMAGPVYQAAGRIGIGARLMLPLSDSGGERVTGILGMTNWNWHIEAPEDQLQVCYIPREELYETAAAPLAASA